MTTEDEMAEVLGVFDRPHWRYEQSVGMWMYEELAAIMAQVRPAHSGKPAKYLVWHEGTTIARGEAKTTPAAQREVERACAAFKELGL